METHIYWIADSLDISLSVEYVDDDVQYLVTSFCCFASLRWQELLEASQARKGRLLQSQEQYKKVRSNNFKSSCTLTIRFKTIFFALFVG